ASTRAPRSRPTTTAPTIGSRSSGWYGRRKARRSSSSRDTKRRAPCGPASRWAKSGGALAHARISTVALAGATFVFLASCATPPAPRAGLEKIQHIVVIYAENRSFDHLYGLFPGADGLAHATPEQNKQVG